MAAAIAAAAELERKVGGRQLLIAIRGSAGSGRDTLLAELLATCEKSALVRANTELLSASESLEPELSGAAAVWDARRSGRSTRCFVLRAGEASWSNGPRCRFPA